MANKEKVPYQLKISDGPTTFEDGTVVSPEELRKMNPVIVLADGKGTIIHNYVAEVEGEIAHWPRVGRQPVERRRMTRGGQRRTKF